MRPGAFPPAFSRDPTESHRTQDIRATGECQAHPGLGGKARPQTGPEAPLLAAGGHRVPIWKARLVGPDLNPDSAPRLPRGLGRDTPRDARSSLPNGPLPRPAARAPVGTSEPSPTAAGTRVQRSAGFAPAAFAARPQACSPASLRPSPCPRTSRPGASGPRGCCCELSTQDMLASLRARLTSVAGGALRACNPTGPHASDEETEARSRGGTHPRGAARPAERQASEPGLTRAARGLGSVAADSATIMRSKAGA